MADAGSIEMTTKFCHACGNKIDQTANMCRYCGVMQPGHNVSRPSSTSVTEKRLLPAMLLFFFLGIFGAHRFYVGKIGTGILMLCTIGGLGIWWLVDLIMMVTGNFTDKAGEKITEWT